MLYSN